MADSSYVVIKDTLCQFGQAAYFPQITGAPLYPDWFAQWTIDYALLHSAIIVTPEYRLLPESTGNDLYSDVKDFWDWLRADLSNHLNTLKSGFEVDLSKVIVHGESAGGTLAIQSGFSHTGFIKAIIASYPGMAIWKKRTSPILRAPTIPPEVLEQHLQNMKPGEIVTAADPPERMHIALSMAQQARTIDFYGSDDILFPMKRLEMVEQVPFVFVLHGKDDSAVPVQMSVDFAEAVTKRFGADNIDLRIEAGEHGFDSTATLDLPWLSAGLKRVTELWLGEI
jgi:acetyl esterase/lipase